jgi:predicted  nucleic acid-binding Zn ribbon protein
MFFSRIHFGNSTRHGRDECEELVDLYLSALHHSGQIAGVYNILWETGDLKAYADISRPDAMRRKYHSSEGSKRLDEIIDLFGAEPDWNVLEDNVPKRFPSWKSSPFLYFHVDWQVFSAPIHTGKDGSDIPAYLLPIDETTRHNIHCWQGHYVDHYGIWMATGELETPAYKQLTDPVSELSEYGRDLCLEVEKAVSIPAYYYLERFWGRKENESNRPCPSCGKKWRVDRRDSANLEFWQFPFRCDRCRLVSHDAAICEDDRYARIGEFRKGRLRP